MGLAALVLLGLAQTGWGKDVLHDAGLRGGATTGYTELAFSTPRTLPRNLANARSVAFTVHNAEGSARDYEWTVTLRGGGPSRVIASGRASVPHGATAAVKATLPDVCADTVRRTRHQVVVGLETAKRETIAFYAACPGRPRG